jgi:hypothetical protein
MVDLAENLSQSSPSDISRETCRMATINRFADFHDEITAWRRDLHQHPEILFDVHRDGRGSWLRS